MAHHPPLTHPPQLLARYRAVLPFACGFATATQASLLQAQSPTNTPSTTPSNPWEILFSGGTTGIIIIVLLLAVSVTALALVVEHLLTIRREVLMPAGLAEQVRQHLVKNDFSTADKVCENSPSALSAVIHSGLQESTGGWPAIEKGVEDALAEQSARLFRKIEYLSVIGNIAPMIGLLGTVIGMIFAFQEVADTQGAARAAELASGIYQALVTTVGGLIIAIPSLAAFAVFRNRVDQLIAETGGQAQLALAPIKRAFQAKRNQPAGVQPSPTVQ